jgi:ADP-ribose pyrophosphatase YjhB (NUDIX family)
MTDAIKQLATLIYVVKDNKVLLARKTRKVNVGKWTGYGGKIDEGESELECAKRELESESGLKIKIESLQKVGIIDFHNSETDVWSVHTYITNEFEGEAVATDEMDEPKWCDIATLDYSTMPWSDVYWLPLILQHDKKVIVEVHQNPFNLSIKELK